MAPVVDGRVDPDLLEVRDDLIAEFAADLPTLCRARKTFIFNAVNMGLTVLKKG